MVNVNAYRIDQAFPPKQTLWGLHPSGGTLGNGVGALSLMDADPLCISYGIFLKNSV
jgi:hypothetical protein